MSEKFVIPVIESWVGRKLFQSIFQILVHDTSFHTENKNLLSIETLDWHVFSNITNTLAYLTNHESIYITQC